MIFVYTFFSFRSFFVSPVFTVIFSLNIYAKCSQYLLLLLFFLLRSFSTHVGFNPSVLRSKIFVSISLKRVERVCYKVEISFNRCIFYYLFPFFHFSLILLSSFIQFIEFASNENEQIQ